ncbi:MAG: hypothetical protein JOZ49_03230, partial [Mycolicibacterium sp.]|nr:hypothetical protein [Mycolicibacterium sp.]
MTTDAADERSREEHETDERSREEHGPVSDEDFQDILAQTRQFVRTAVVPREHEILTE